MKWTLIALVCWSNVALADVSPWDATYQTDARGGNELCPDASASVVVSGGKFSIVWNFQGRGGKQLFRVGRIEGSVRDTGFAVFTATLMDPFPSAAAAELAALDDKVEQLQQIAKDMKIVLTARKDKRALDLTSGNCYARWVATGGVPEAKVAAAPAKASKPAKAFKAPAPMAAGSSKWDSTYAMTTHYTSEWWCPRGEGFKTVVVKQGRLAIPWRLEMTSRTGRSFGDTLVGQLDGSIAATGSVKVRGSFVDDLPPEMEGKSITSVKQMKPTVKLEVDGGRGRKMHLAIGSACEYDLTASDYKVPKAPAVSGSGRSITPDGPSKRRGDKVNGAQCQNDAMCQSGICSQGMCSKQRDSFRKGHNGAECQSDYDCASGNCDDDGRCASGDRHHKELGTGAKCDDNDDCSSGQCDDGVCDD